MADYIIRKVSNSGKYCYGKSPMQIFSDGEHLALEKNNELLYLQSMTDPSKRSLTILTSIVLSV